MYTLKMCRKESSPHRRRAFCVIFISNRGLLHVYPEIQIMLICA
jgi:hypothetical protein